MKGSQSIVVIAASLPSWSALSGLQAGRRPEGKPSLPPNVERARGILKDGLDSKDYMVRIQAITAASMVGRNETLIERLGSFLEDKNLEVRLAAVGALGDLNSPQSTAALRNTLRGTVRLKYRLLLPKF